MTDPVLNYAPPAVRLQTLARRPAWACVAVAVVLPGFASMLVGGRAGGRKFAALTGTTVAAFVFFGVFWNEVLYKDVPVHSDGLWQFLTCGAVAVTASVIFAVLDRADVRRAAIG